MAEQKKFYESWAESLSKTAKNLSEKASNVYDTQKLRSRITTEERTVEKLKSDIGMLIFSRYENGEFYEGEVGRLCMDIREHLDLISELEKESARLRGKKICPSCRKEICIGAQYCPCCGTVCPVPEPEDEEGMEAMPEDSFEKGERCPCGDPACPVTEPSVKNEEEMEAMSEDSFETEEVSAGEITKDDFLEAAEAVKEDFTETAEVAKEGFTEAAEAVKEDFTETAEAVKEGFTEVAEESAHELSDAAEDAAASLKEGAEDAAASLEKDAKGAAASLKKRTRKAKADSDDLSKE